MPRRHALARKKITIHHSVAERKRLHFLRKQGPAAVKRAAHRHEVLDTLPCGCKRTRVRMETCPEHTPGYRVQQRAEADTVTTEAAE